ncbi:hypothetical protein COU03_01960 [bacterium (Candidatus Gribaldobacteria) CG10_big_fil_rev_8_21_14_0_10_41_12]|uniref:Uncharacterized protein n=1 Tax=bacterium (Candidatus Gribaldobacteria) CG10_big_fil_rev_8_21_14_0_10_41_12 TaxID=2014277 RepID=A0A2H0UZF4_9BACT|nr:MAG: hypothetical protein COU03_01960 [bacterium (Candidatus Gribaldobacteria) CG10_big_fil_rev_8_21_14_0_10_41_12]
MVGGGLFFYGCLPTISKEPDVTLTGAAGDAKKISELWPKLQAMVKKPYEQLKIGLLQDEKMTVVRLWVDDKAHLYFFDEKTSQAGSLRFGWKKTSPSIKFVDSEGNLLKDGDKEMEYAFWGDKQAAPTSTAIDTGQWFLWAIEAVAIGFGVWLVAKVGIFLLSALAFIAFNLMVLALLVAGAAIIYGAAQIFFKTTGITLDDIKEWFLGEVEDLNIFIRQVAEGLGG